MTKYFYVGLMSGLDMMYSRIPHLLKNDTSYIPLAFNVMGLFPVGKRFCPFVQASAGSYFGIQALLGVNGFYSDI